MSELNKDFIYELQEVIRTKAQEYYEGNSTISDSEFDKLVEKLYELDPSNELLHTVGWGYDVSKNSKMKCDHLGNCVGISDKYFISENDNIYSSNTIFLGKFDGGSVELIYNNGVLVKALTRGNGAVGLDVTEKLKYIVPQSLSEPYTGNIVGEFLLPKMNSNKFESESIRNIPNGFLQRDRVKEWECKLFAFVPYKITKFKPNSLYSKLPETRIEVLDTIEELGFDNVADYLDSRTLGTEYTYLDLFNRLKYVQYTDDTAVEFLLDGLVLDSTSINVKKESNGYFEIEYLGEKAYKTRSDTAEVTITEISWNLTRTKRLVPVLHFDPVKLSGASVKRCTGHNFKSLHNSGIGVGSIVEVVRSGEVIPHILQVINPTELDYPKTCPVCGEDLRVSGADLVCTNPECESSNYNSVVHWIKVLGLVDNLGSSLIDKFIEFYDISSVDDIYTTLPYISEFYNAPGVGSSKVEVIKDMYRKLEEPKKLNHLLVALNLPNLSYESAYKIVSNTSLYDMIVNNDIDPLRLRAQLRRVKRVSSKAKEGLLNNIDLVKYYSDNYVKLLDPKVVEEHETELENNTQLLKIYVTGKLESFTNRDQLYKELSNKVVKENKISECDYFVTNKRPLSTRHYKDALTNNIPIISEQELLDLLN